MVGRRGGSLYDAVRRLERAGMIEALGTEREGRRPERTTYTLTPEGRTALRDWVRDGLRDPDRSFMYAHGRDEAVARVHERRERLEQTIAHAETELTKALEAGVGEIFLSEERYAQHLRQEEREWLTDFTDKLGDGTLRWPRRSRSR